MCLWQCVQTIKQMWPVSIGYIPSIWSSSCKLADLVHHWIYAFFHTTSITVGQTCHATPWNSTGDIHANSYSSPAQQTLYSRRHSFLTCSTCNSYVILSHLLSISNYVINMRAWPDPTGASCDRIHCKIRMFTWPDALLGQLLNYPLGLEPPEKCWPAHQSRCWSRGLVGG